MAYARRLVRAGDLAAGEQLPRRGAGAKPGDAAAKAGALLGLAEAALARQDARAALERFERLTVEHPDAPEAGEAWLMRVQLHAKDGQLDKALAEVAIARTKIRDDGQAMALEEAAFWLERQRAQATLARWGERALAVGDADALHRAARAALERRLLLGTAVAWAEKAVAGSGRDPLVLETWAELLYETGAAEKAVAALVEALRSLDDAEARPRLEDKIARYRAGLPARPPSGPDVGAAPARPRAPGPRGRAAGAPGPVPPPPPPRPLLLPAPPPEPAMPETPPRALRTTDGSSSRAAPSVRCVPSCRWPPSRRDDAAPPRRGPCP